jgi:hypothetical protein
MTATTQGSCDFCDGTGRWIDAVLGATDPCPACDARGTVSPGTCAPTDDGTAGGDDREILHAVGGLTQAERQRLYEELHRRWNCRIYRS